MHFIKTIPIGGKAFAMCMLISSLLAAAPAGASTATQTTSPLAQQEGVVKVSGQVLDENGIPVGGAYVSVVGTANGTTTDAEGKWTLNVPKGSTLEFSFLGFVTETVTVTGPGNISLVLRQDSEFLDEIVVN